jgi:DnaK suppressor protein
MAIRKEKVENIKIQLVQRRDAIAADLRSATAHLIDDVTVYTDSVDQAAADTEKNFTLQLRNRERDVLLQINEALRRVESGTFGICEQCEEPISEGRIEAFPFTTLCIECKGELESEEHRFPRRA